MFDQGIVQVGFGVVLGQVEELDQITVLEDAGGVGVHFSHRWCEFYRGKYDPLKKGA
ncbi:MAG TPA: hypothetical protein VHX68_10175 [Planctomycetaceae bacterium]|nr:hypothetical protein [Planctomycetaceae bacterium]